MKTAIIYFARAFSNKPNDNERKQIYSTRNQYKATISKLSDVIRIYEQGYHFRLENSADLTHFIVIDIDDCIDGTREAIQAWIAKNRLEDSWWCGYSASKSENKCKIFAWLDTPISATSKNLERVTFEKLNILKDNLADYYSKIEPDSHQFKNTTQLTFGLPRKQAFVDSILNGLPTDESHIEYRWKSRVVDEIRNNTRIHQFLDDFNRKNECYLDIPINKRMMLDFLCQYRPDIFSNPENGFTNQMVSVWTTYCYKDGRLSMVYYPDGSRHRAIEHTIIPVVIENALILNFIYGQNITIDDVLMNVVKWCNYTFEKKDGQSWMNKEGYFEKYRNYIKEAYRSRLLMVNWTECYGDDYETKKQFFIDNYEPFEDSIVSYKPRNKERMAKLKHFREIVLPDILSRNFTSENEIQNYILFRMNLYTDLDLANELLMRAMRLVKKTGIYKFLSNERFDKGKPHRPHKPHKVKYNCSGMDRNEFETYCKVNNINRMTKIRLLKKYHII